MTQLQDPTPFRYQSNATLIAHANQLANDDAAIAESPVICELLREMAWRLVLLQGAIR
jgi:hypothetical protein